MIVHCKKSRNDNNIVISAFLQCKIIQFLLSFFNILFLAHLSRRLIGELLVYRGIRRPSVRRPSSVVRPSSTFSNDFFSEAAVPILLIFHI